MEKVHERYDIVISERECVKSGHILEENAQVQGRK